MKTFEELREALKRGRDKDTAAPSVDRQYSSNYKIIQIPGKPGELDEPTISPDGSVIPPGYRKFRAGAVVFPKAPSGQPKAPDFRSSDDEFADRAKELFQKRRVERNKQQRKEVNESNIHKAQIPFMLTLKKVTTRQYPNNVEVALYYNDKLKKYFSVTFDGNENDNAVLGEWEIVDSFLKLFSKLNETNKDKMLGMLNEKSYQALKEFVLEENFNK